MQHSLFLHAEERAFHNEPQKRITSSGICPWGIQIANTTSARGIKKQVVAKLLIVYSQFLLHGYLESWNPDPVLHGHHVLREACFSTSTPFSFAIFTTAI